MRFSVIADIDTHQVLQEVRGLSERVGGGLGADFAGPAVSRELAAIEREYFDSSGDGAWPPLAMTTVSARLNRWGHYSQPPAAGVSATGPVLQWTRRLAESLGDPRGRGAPDAFIRMTPNELEQGTLVPYAIYHMGGPRVPKRPPVKTLTEEDKERLLLAMLRFIRGEEA